jgi:DNA-binding transcriptional MocR family regulator
LYSDNIISVLVYVKTDIVTDYDIRWEWEAMHLYERIYEDLRHSIDEGEIRPSERLPSIREVAVRYGCNKLTAQRAFDLLAAAGVVENLVGSGSFVTFPEPPAERSGDFSAARLSEDFFPFEAAGRLLAEILAEERGRVFSASPPRGEPGLIEALARRFNLPSSSIVVTGGGLQSLDICRRLFAGRTAGGTHKEPRILVEEPCFPAALSLFRPQSSLLMGHTGPDPCDFAAFFSALPNGESWSAGVFYSVPDIHNPTGSRYAEVTKREIVRIARELDVWIVEDDYLSELEPSGIPRFVDLAPERTIWIKSLSKTTAPGIRIGAIAAPPSLVSRVEALKAEVDPGPAAWLQFLAERLLGSGLLDEELRRTAEVVRQRRVELIRLLNDFPGLSFDADTAGYNLWVTTEHEPNLAQVPWAEGRRFGFGPEMRLRFRLSFMAIGETEWPQTLKRLELSLQSAFGSPR